MHEFLHGNDSDASVEDEWVIGNTTFVHVGGQPRHFMMLLMAHKTVMTKDILACMLDTHFVEENPMVIGHEETWLVMMGSDECADDGWVEAPLNFVDFDLNVLSELSEERSDAGSEEFFECGEDKPCITMPIGCDLNGESVEEEIESDGEECDEDDVAVVTMGANDRKWGCLKSFFHTNKKWSV